MNKKKILSLIMALVMLVGVFSPLTALAEGESTEKDAKTETVTLHKILQTKANLENGKFPGHEGLDGSKYDGNQIKKDKLAGYFGTDSIEIEGVYFALKFAADYGTTTDEKAMAGKYVKADAQDKLKPASPLAATENIEEAVGGLTQKNNAGVVFKTAELKGNFEIDEIHNKSTYIGKDGKKTLTDMKAVPVKIKLPLVNDKGTVINAHVYPKNTEEKPTTNKDFSDKFTKDQNGRDENVDEKTIQDNPANSDKEKKENWEPKNVGDTVNYTVRTTIPAKANYATAYWNDEMTDGLDLDINSVKLAYTGNNDVTLEKDTDYTIKATSNEGKQGFELEFTAAGLGKINGKENEGVITITYSAKLNENAVVAVPESNDVNFYYGNNPRKGNTPKPNYPDDNGKLKVTKTWADGEWAKNEKATFKIVDAQTGKTVTKDELVGAPEGYVFNATKEIGYTGDKTAEWEYLDKNKQYKIVEVSVTYEDKDGKTQTLTGWEANYAVNGKGETKVTNYKTNNPEPLNPTEPKVVTYGAKFVKTDTEGKRLPGAEFAIKNAEGNFLTGTEADRTAYKTAQKAYEDAVKAYNQKVANKQTPTDEEKANIVKLEKARDAAWNATLKDMTQWGKEKDAFKLTSNELGQFEIAGLAPGKYTLVEITPPEGYANNKNEFPFEIKENGNQATLDIDFGVKIDNAAYNAQQVINKKVTIPQTGGIGTVLFTVVGIGLMAGAVMAMKKNREEA